MLIIHFYFILVIDSLAVSLPLRASGYSAFKSFWYGQLSGMVEPAAGRFQFLEIGPEMIDERIIGMSLAYKLRRMLTYQLGKRFKVVT